MLNFDIIKKNLENHINQIVDLNLINKNRVFIHVGLHKCASTSLQFSWRNTRINNLIYFKEIFLIEKFVTSNPNDKTIEVGKEFLRILIKKYLSKSKNSIIIMSSEFLLKSATKQNYTKRIDSLSIFSAFAEFIVIKKKEEEYIRSIYWQFLKSGRFISSEEDFKKKHRDVKIDSYFKKMMNYFSNSIDVNSNVHLFNLDGLGPKENIEHYVNFKLFSKDQSVVFDSNKVLKNKSPSRLNVLKIQKIVSFIFSNPPASQKKLDWSRFTDVPIRHKLKYLIARFTIKEISYKIIIYILTSLIFNKKSISVKREVNKSIKKYEIL